MAFVEVVGAGILRLAGLFFQWNCGVRLVEKEPRQSPVTHVRPPSTEPRPPRTSADGVADREALELLLLDGLRLAAAAARTYASIAVGSDMVSAAPGVSLQKARSWDEDVSS